LKGNFCNIVQQNAPIAIGSLSVYAVLPSQPPQLAGTGYDDVNKIFAHVKAWISKGVVCYTGESENVVVMRVMIGIRVE
jgi:hypothetical protein